VSDVTELYRRFGVRLPPLQDGWASTRCFAGRHHDRHPSARVHLRSGGFKCFACGSKGGILDALQLLGVYDRDEARQLATDYGILDPPKRSKRKPVEPTPPPPSPPPEPAGFGGQIDWDNLADNPVVQDRNWVYVDQHSRPVGRVRRLDLADGQKRIWQERPDGEGWATGLNGAHLPIYRLPEVIAHARQGRRILIVEGEKAVDALDRIGFFATTNAGGAGKWHEHHSKPFTGATVLTICDCDQPGRRHAYDVSVQLLAAGVAVLAPLDPSPLDHDGYDIVDYLAAVADTIRTVTPDISDANLRAGLHDHLRKLASQQLIATVQTLERWHEYTEYQTRPHGLAYIHCERCGYTRVHRVRHGLAFCPCGAHQAAV
jgi:hypothetical protein